MKLVATAYLASFFLSLLGNSIAAIALPLLVLQMTGSPVAGGTLALASGAAAFLAGLLLGALFDRINRRTSSVATDLVSAAAVAALPIVDAVTGLNLGWFVLFGIIGAVGDVPGMTAREAWLPAIVRHSGLAAERIIGLREMIGGISMLLGPALAGTLMTVFDGSTVLWITAATSLGAALTTMIIPGAVGDLVNDDGSPATPPAGSTGRQLLEGWRLLTGSRFLLAATWLGVAGVVALGAFQGIVLPVYFTVIEQPGMLGFVLSSLALGMFVGGGVYAAVAQKLGRRAWLVGGVIGFTLGVAVMALLVSPWIVFGGAFLLGVAMGPFNGALAVLVMERTPEHARGRILGIQNALNSVAGPVAIFLVALVAERGSIGAAAAGTAAFWLVAAVITLWAPAFRDLESPTGVEPHAQQ